MRKFLVGVFICLLAVSVGYAQSVGEIIVTKPNTTVPSSGPAGFSQGTTISQKVAPGYIQLRLSSYAIKHVGAITADTATYIDLAETFGGIPTVIKGWYNQDSTNFVIRAGTFISNGAGTKTFVAANVYNTYVTGGPNSSSTSTFSADSILTPFVAIPRVASSTIKVAYSTATTDSLGFTGNNYSNVPIPVTHLQIIAWHKTGAYTTSGQSYLALGISGEFPNKSATGAAYVGRHP